MKKQKQTKKYMCKECGDQSDIMTLGDMYSGCANCGSLKGFTEKGKGDVKKTPELDYLNRFMSGL